MIPADWKSLMMSHYYSPTTISAPSDDFLMVMRPRGKVELVYIDPKVATSFIDIR